MLRSIETTHVVWPFCCLDFASKDPSPSQDGGGSPRMPIHKFCQIIHFAIQRNPTSVTQKISKLLLNDMSWMDGPQRWTSQLGATVTSRISIQIYTFMQYPEHSWTFQNYKCMQPSPTITRRVTVLWDAMPGNLWDGEILGDGCLRSLKRWNDLGQDTRTYW